MPRTKVLRKTKRNRLASIRDEKIREYESKLEQFINAFDWKIRQNVQEIEIEIDLLKSRIPQKMRVMKLGDLMTMRVRTFSDIEPKMTRVDQLRSRTRLLQPLKRSKDDEGYLTGDSRGSGKNGTPMSVAQSRLVANTQRHPGLLGSAKVIRRRRSRSACGKIVQTKGEDGHVSRQMTRTPLMTRQKALSADRTISKPRDIPNSPTWLRWPKPGELVVSVTGSPVVAQGMPDSFANVNIPLRDGVISLRPKKLQNVDPELVHRIDRETLSQIKLLQSNLEMILRFAHKK